MLLLLRVFALVHVAEDRRRKKAQHPAVIEPTTFLLRGVCFTAMLHLLPSFTALFIVLHA